MTDIDMKQKIKEVRDKFLSNNQIEDIRQNITLGVEERLKFLNSEQIKVVELLEEKHRDLDKTLKDHTLKIDEEKRTVEDKFDNKISKIEVQFKEQFGKLAAENSTLISKHKELHLQLEKELKAALENHEKSIGIKIEQIVKEQTEVKTLFNQKTTELQSTNNETIKELKDSASKSLVGMENAHDLLLKNFSEKELTLINDVENKLSVFDSKEEILLEEVNSKLENAIVKLELKIKEFVENHKTVEDIIDNRLKEFRTAQKAAFEELEAALNLLEKHQDETITRFKNHSEAGFGKLTGSHNDVNKNRNRGSILHQATDVQDDSATNVNQIEVVSNDRARKRKNRILKPLIFSIISLLVLIYVIINFQIGYDTFLQILNTFTG